MFDVNLHLFVCSSVFKSSSKTLWDLSTEDPVKGDISPEAFQHLMEEPIRRMTQYKKLFSNLSQKHKQVSEMFGRSEGFEKFWL